MNSSRPISSLRVIWLITRLAVRRQRNIWKSIRLTRRKKKAPELSLTAEAKRTGTATKSTGRSIFSGFLLVVMGFNGFNIGAQGLARLSNIANHVGEISDRMVVSRYTEVQLAEAQKALRRAEEISNKEERTRYVEGWNRYVNGLLEREVRGEALSEEEESNRLEQMRAVFAAKGAEGFTHRGAENFWVSSETWPRDGDAKFLFFRSISIITCVWVLMMTLIPLGLNNKNLGQVEWSFEWMFTFPAEGRALFASKILAYSALNPLVWLFFLPFLILAYLAGGAGPMAVVYGLLAVLYFSILAGATTTILEVALRKFLSLGQIKNFQAVCTVFGTVALLLCYASSLSKPLDEFLVHSGGKIPVFLMWNPLSLPLVLSLPGAARWQIQLSAGGMMILSIAAVWLALRGSEWLTQDGLVKAGGPYQGSRRVLSGGTESYWLRGIAAKEVLLLGRDRNLFVQVVILPLLLPGYFFLINSNMISAVTGNFRHAAAMVFGVGAYSFLSTAMQTLNREDQTLWYLLSLPQSLDSILRKKAMVWAAIGLCYGGAVLLLLVHYSRHLHGSAWGNVFLALYGIALYAFIASGIGILATNVMETEKRARFRTDMVYLYMILAAMYANTIYSASVWGKLAQLVLSTLLAIALWQKVKDICPYILDPVDQPPRTISLADGMIAALAFFVVQGLIAVFLHWGSSAAPAAQITMAYTLAGLIVGSMTLLILWRQGVPDLWGEIGLARRDDRARVSSVGRGVLQGIAWGAIAALGAIVYVRVLNLFPQWQTWKQEAEMTSFFTRAANPAWLIALTILAAPLFEEFLFRGLVFQGLRRSIGPALAVLASAALFALIHPPISVIPVFGLGIAAALSFQRTGLLLAPIVAHSVYNASVFLFNKL